MHATSGKFMGGKSGFLAASYDMSITFISMKAVCISYDTEPVTKDGEA